MNPCANFAVVSVLLQLTVPSYALRLVRRFGAQRVGWFLVAAFSTLALLHLLSDSQDPRQIRTDLLYASVCFLLILGMGHLESLFTCTSRSRSALIKIPAVKARCDEALVAAPTAEIAESAEAVRRRFETVEWLAREQLRHDSARQLAGGAGQALQNALTIIRAQSELLLRKTAANPARQQLEQIAVAATRALSFTGHLLIMGGRYRGQPELLDLNRLVQSLDGRIGKLVGGQVAFRKLLRPDLPLLFADAKLLEQVLLNLIVYSHSWIQGRGSVDISTWVVGGDDRPIKPGALPPPGWVCLTIRCVAPCTVARRQPVPPQKSPAPGDVAFRLATVRAALEHLSAHMELTDHGTGHRVHVYFPPAALQRARTA